MPMQALASRLFRRECCSWDPEISRHESHIRLKDDHGCLNLQCLELSTEVADTSSTMQLYGAAQQAPLHDVHEEEHSPGGWNIEISHASVAERGVVLLYFLKTLLAPEVHPASE